MLLAEGERLAGASGEAPTLTEALTTLALGCGAPEGSDLLRQAVDAGLAEAERSLAPLTPPTAPAAGLTTWVLPAAACAYVSTGGAPVDMTDVTTELDAGLRDVAAALMVVRAPTGSADEPPGEGLLLGHALAAGWLATQLWASGVVGAPGSFEATVAAVVGAP